MKRCTSCKRLLSLDCFCKVKTRGDGYCWWCRECVAKYRQDNKEKISEYGKKYQQKNKVAIAKQRAQYWQKNKDARTEYAKKYNKFNKEAIIKYTKKYYQKHKEEYAKFYQNNKDKYAKYHQDNKERILKRAKQYNLKNKEKHVACGKLYRQKNKKRIAIRKNNYDRHRYKEDSIFKLNKAISHSIRQSLKIRNTSKNGRHWETLVNFTLPELIVHLENLFQEEMTWDNQGKWHIDHIKPKSLFNFESVDDSEFKECWNLNNLQPLWAADNIRKHNKYIEAIQ